MKTERTIRNCPVRVKFECPKKWEALDRTEVDTIRYCNACQKNVYFCNTDEETIKNAKLGNCIAREIPSRDELPMLFVGEVEEQPEETAEQKHALEWTRREERINEILKLKNPEKYCYNCGYPTSTYRKTCKVCGAEFNIESNQA